MAMEKFHHEITITTTEKDGDGNEREVTSKLKLTLPLMQNIPFGFIRKNRKLPQFEQMFALLEMVLSEKDIEALDGATQGDVNTMMEAWQKASNVNVGES